MEDLILKPTTTSDYEDYYKIRSDPSDIYWNGYDSKPDKKKFYDIFLTRLGESRFESPEDRRIFLIQLTDNNSNITVGFLQLILRTDGIDIGYTVSEDYHGKGYATEALKLGIMMAKKFDERIYVQIRDDNIASQCVAKKCGFTPSDQYRIIKYPQVGDIALRKYFLS